EDSAFIIKGTSALTGSSAAAFFFSSRRRHTRSKRDWSSDVCSSDLSPTPCEPPSAKGQVTEDRQRRRRPRMKKPTTSKRSRTDWKRVDAQRDQEIDFSDIPELTPEMFARAVVRRGVKLVPRKEQLTIRGDRDVLD